MLRSEKRCQMSDRLRLWLCGAVMLALLLPLFPQQADAADGRVRNIVVISENVNITVALGTFEGGLSPLPDERTGEGTIRAGEPVSITGQLVDGNYTLLSYGGGMEAAKKNNGVSGNGEELRWWFNGVEQSPVPVSYRAPGNKDESVINGTFCIRDWIADRSLAPRGGVYQLHFSFEGTRVYYPGYGEFQIYPPAESIVPIRVLFPTESRLSCPDTVDAGSTVALEGTVKGADGALPYGGVVVSTGGMTLGPAMPAGVYIDDVQVSIPGIPTVVYIEGFEAGSAGWTFGGDANDWDVGKPLVGPAPKHGQACLGTNLESSYKHMAEEWAEMPSINLSNFQSPVTLSFSAWLNLSSGDHADVTVFNGRSWSDPVRMNGQQGVWSDITLELDTLTEGGKPFCTQGASELKARFRLKSMTPSAAVVNGAFGLDWKVPENQEAGPTTLTVKFVPAGNHSASFTYRTVTVRAKMQFIFPIDYGWPQALTGGWAEVNARLLNSRGKAQTLPSVGGGTPGLHVLWDNGTGDPVEAESLTAVNTTGWFAAAHRLLPGEKLGVSAFILVYNGDATHQAARDRIGAEVRGQPSLVLNTPGAASKGKEATVSGRLMLGKSPLDGRVVGVWLPFEPFRLNATTGTTGNFSASFKVPSSFEGETVHVDFWTALADHYLINTRAALDLPVTGALVVEFESVTAAKGQRIRTAIGSEEFDGLAGRVSDDNGNPVSGAYIVIDAARPGGSTLLGRCRSGPTGYFSMPFSVPWTESSGPLVLGATASAASFESGKGGAVLTITARTMVAINPLPEMRPGSFVFVTGLVREDWDGMPGDFVRNAAMDVSFAGQPLSAYTDAGGRFSARCAVAQSEGTVKVSARFGGTGILAASYSEVSTQVIPSSGPPVVPPAPPAPGLSAAGAAVAGASVISVCAAAVAIGGTEVGRVKVLIALVPLYSKIRKEAVLDQFVRGQVYGYIHANPGDHYSSIRESLKLKNGTLAYHLRTLEREQFIFSRMDGIYRRFYPSGADPAQVRLYRNIKETPRKFLEMIEKHPGITPKELGEKLGTSHQVASYHVRILARKGKVRLEERGRNTLCYLAGDMTGAGGAEQ